MANFIKYKTIYFIGIGGIGLSALARYFLSRGFKVAGSDRSSSPIITDLANEGALIHIGHDANNLKKLKNVLIIHSQAIKADNPEMEQAKKMDLECRSYPQVIGELTKKFKTIALAGAHGKSTTTALVALIMIEAGLDPTVIIGTKLKEFNGSNFRSGKSNYLVLEADEYGGAFWNYFPFISAITNIDREHLDFYRNFSGVKRSFRKFLKNHKVGSRIIYNDLDKNLKKIVSASEMEPVPISKVDPISQRNIKNSLKIYGEHNFKNALVAYSIGRALDIPHKTILKALGHYEGAWRRMEFRGNLKIHGANGRTISIFDDYAHHPNEIKATLQGLREKYPKNYLICVFQPHQAQRLKLLFNDFKKAFKKADRTVLLPIYKVIGREKILEEKYSSRSLSKFVKKSIYTEGPEKDLLPVIESIIKGIKSPITIVFMGAGDINMYSEQLLTKYK